MTFSSDSFATSSFPSPTPTTNGTQNRTIASTGTGSSYAQACWSAVASWSSSYNSYTSAHRWVSTTLLTFGPTSVESVTYFENATTLCDGHPRVTYSPAIPTATANITHSGLSISTSTILGTYFSAYGPSAPSCSIDPSDCDPLWAAYSTSVSAAGPLITASPIVPPPCANSSEAALLSQAHSMITGCGTCTIYGQGVQLVYFPTTVSVDYCASTPTANLTHYGPGAVITAYAGKSAVAPGEIRDNRTVFAEGHAFTTGTAYISISTVYAVDRCSNTYGTPINDAILAMPSQSVLSLRYRQDHFQAIMETDKITGYPVSYADFNSPVPWSAWNGQTMCDPGGYGGWACSIIYEDQYRPQLAIPPQVTQLSPHFEGCQMWYNGLWDPPLALQPQTAADGPGFGPDFGGHWATSTAAAPSSTPGSPTAPATAMPVQQSTSTTPGNQLPGPTQPPSQSPKPYSPEAEPWMQSVVVDGLTLWATGANRQVHIESASLTSGGPSSTIEGGLVASYGSNGLILRGGSTAAFDQHQGGPTQQTQSNGGTGAAITSGLSGPGSQPEPSDADTTTINIDGSVMTCVQSSDGGPVVIDKSTTLTPGGSATTLPNGHVISAASDSLVVEWSSTLGQIAASATSGGNTASQTTRSRPSGITSGVVDGNAQTLSTQSSGTAALETGSGCKMSSSQALSFFAALVGLTFAIGT